MPERQLDREHLEKYRSWVLRNNGSSIHGQSSNLAERSIIQVDIVNETVSAIYTTHSGGGFISESSGDFRGFGESRYHLVFSGSQTEALMEAGVIEK